MSGEKKDRAIEQKKQEVKSEKKEKVQVPAKFKSLVEAIEKLSVLELSELVKVLEERLGVSAAALPAGAAPAGVSEEGAAAAQAPAKTAATVHLKQAGNTKIQVIKAVKELMGLGLKDAKDLVDKAPVDLKSDLKPEEAEEWKKKLEEVGAVVEMK
jgi:large subunit ribosomal protein L7/L12